MYPHRKVSKTINQNVHSEIWMTFLHFAFFFFFGIFYNVTFVPKEKERDLKKNVYYQDSKW